MKHSSCEPQTDGRMFPGIWPANLSPSKLEKIRRLNDGVRHNLTGGLVILKLAVDNLSQKFERWPSRQ